MPRLPSVESLGARPIPTPGATVTPIHGAAFDSYGGQAMENVGKMMLNLGEQFAIEKKKDTELRAEEYTNTLRQKQIDLTFGENGFLTKKGANAVNGNLYQDYNKLFNHEVQQIENQLTSPELKEAFRKRAEMVQLQFNENILRHVTQERDIHAKTVYKTTVATEAQIAAAQHNDVNAISTSMVRVTSAAKEEAKRLGLLDENSMKIFVREAQGEVNNAVLQQMIDTDNYQAADEYLKANRDAVDHKMVTYVEKAVAQGKASQEVDKIWEEFGPKNVNDPVMLFNMEQEARKRLSSNQDGMKAAIQELRLRKEAFNAQQIETNAANHASVMDAYNKGTSLKEIRKMPSFIALSGTEQNQITTYITDRGYTLSQRAKADKNSDENINNWAEYYRLTREDPNLSNMTENQIMALVPKIGLPMVNRLMTIKRDVNNPLHQPLDRATVAAALYDVGIDPFPKVGKEKAKIAKFEDALNIVLSEKRKEKKRKLFPEEIKAEAQRLADQKVMEDRWGFDTEHIAAMVPPEKRADVYIPLEQIPQDQVLGMLNLMRSRGRIDPKMTDAEATRKFKDSMQKAYARFLAGGTQQEVNNALAGK